MASAAIYAAVAETLLAVSVDSAVHTKAWACAECLEVELADGAKSRDEAFLAAMYGKAKHRIKDAKSVLCRTDTEV